MSYRLKSGQSVLKNVRRIATEQIDGALRDMDNDELSFDNKVHQVRKACKKIRGLIRLVRPEFEKSWRKENEFFRDAGRLLSELRDANTMQSTYDAVVGHFADQINRRAFGSIRRRLTLQRKLLNAEKRGVAELMETCRTRLLTARNRVSHWRFKQQGFAAVRDGLTKNYSRARHELAGCRKQPTDEQFHGLRKRTKYHWYHLRLLQDVWPQLIRPRRMEAHRLAALLGDEHDLAVLRQSLLSDPERFGKPSDIDTFVALINKRRRQLQRRSLRLGKKMFAESAPRFVSRLGKYWNASR